MGDHIVRELMVHETNPEKFTAITNGFDPELIPVHSHSETPTAPFVIGYIGNFFKDRSPRPFLLAVEHLLKTGQINPQDIRIRFVSNFKGPIPSFSSATSRGGPLLLQSEGTIDDFSSCFAYETESFES